jgi:hypothetical protein
MRLVITKHCILNLNPYHLAREGSWGPLQHHSTDFTVLPEMRYAGVVQGSPQPIRSTSFTVSVKKEARIDGRSQIAFGSNSGGFESLNSHNNN